MALNKRRKKTEPTVLDQIVELGKTVGIDLTQEYDPEAFSSMWVSLYQSEDPDSYVEQGAVLFNQLLTLYKVLADKNAEQSAPIERRTKVWYQHSLVLQDKTDSEIVDGLLGNYPSLVKPISDDRGSVALLAIQVIDDEVIYG